MSEKFTKFYHGFKVEDVRAAKEHTCDICHGKIQKGEVYSYISVFGTISYTYPYNPYPLKIKSCLEHDVNEITFSKMRVCFKNKLLKIPRWRYQPKPKKGKK